MSVRTKIESFTKDDFKYYFQLVGNEKVMAMITERAHHHQEAKDDFKKLLQNNQIHPSFGHFKVLDIESGEFIGMVKLEIKEETDENAELGYMLLPKYWGKGIASRLSREMLEIATKQEAIKGLYAIIDPKNLASRKVLTKIGFVSKEFKDFDGLPGELLELKLR